jgi:putative membrane protein
VSDASLERRLGSGAWHRLHPLSPIVRAGRGAIAIVVVLVPSLLTGGRDFAGSLVQLAIVGVLTVLGVVSWLVTRWQIEDGTLRIETGLIRRSSLRFPLTQMQAIDVVRPGLARIFGLAELRLRMGGTTGGHARLAYLPERDAEMLRERLLESARGAVEPDERPQVDEDVLTTLSSGRLIGSILLSGPGIVAELLLGGAVAAGVFAPAAATAVAGGSLPMILGALTFFWRRFNQEYRLTVAEAPDGLRLRGGLVALTSETIPRGRVQAVRMIEPLLWRPFRWCRLEVDVAGRQRRKGEGSPEGRQLRAVLPVGSRALALDLLERIVPGAPAPSAPAPRRVRLKSPLHYRNLAWGRTDRCAVTTSGRVTRVTAWVPLGKVQSLRRVQGPVQRWLRLATVHLDTAGRNVEAALRDRDTAEAEAALADLIRLSRAARA